MTIPTIFDTSLLLRPESAELRFLPEGPRPAGPGKLTWVAIQHGPQATTGSLNLLDMESGANTSYPLDGRPGFAVATSREGVMLIGLERRLVLFDRATRQTTTICEGIEADVEGTIINDGELVPGGVVFGAKDLQFKDKKAGLYFLRNSDQKLFRLRNDQICSNGKVWRQADGRLSLMDICSLRKSVVEYQLDVEAGRLEEVRTVVDLTSEPVFPDGMIGTPDGQSLIIAIYNPQPAPFGEARQYGIRSGRLEAVWRTPGSPQVTCPRLVRHRGRICLVLTTAVEHMDAQRLADSPNAGCLFLGDTPFEQLGEELVWQLPQ